eukprot:11262908-Heterocapsa_arctica.AAC.1
MHPMIQQMCKARTYTRRSESPQIGHQKYEDRRIEDRHRQTCLGEEETKQTHTHNYDKLGPEEEGSRMRDVTARQKHEGENKEKYGRLYKEEKQTGTIITSANLSGSQFDFEFMLKH